MAGRQAGTAETTPATGKMSHATSVSCDLGEIVLPKKKCTDIGGPMDLFIYLKQNPRTFIAVSWFFGTFLTVLCLAALYYANLGQEELCYWTAGAFGIVTCVYGFCHFRTLLGLKQQVDDYSKNNLKFRSENHELRNEVDRFQKAHRGLVDGILFRLFSLKMRCFQTRSTYSEPVFCGIVHILNAISVFIT